MEELVLAVEKLSEKTFVDYMLIIVPILTSFVAIFISVSTAAKQNRVALFEKRYEVLAQIRVLIAFSKSVEECDDEKILIYLFDSYFGTNLHNNDLDDRFTQALYRIELIINNALQAQFLFSAPTAKLEEAAHHLREFMLSVVYNKSYQECRNAFCRACNDFYKTDFKEMAKEAQISKVKKQK